MTYVTTAWRTLTNYNGPQHLWGMWEEVTDELQVPRTVSHKAAKAYNNYLPTTPAALGESQAPKTLMGALHRCPATKFLSALYWSRPLSSGIPTSSIWSTPPKPPSIVPRGVSTIYYLLSTIYYLLSTIYYLLWLYPLHQRHRTCEQTYIYRPPTKEGLSARLPLRTK